HRCGAAAARRSSAEDTSSPKIAKERPTRRSPRGGLFCVRERRGSLSPAAREKGRSVAAPALPFRLAPALPDAHALFRGEVVLLARLDVEGLVPGVDVAQRADDPELGRAVRIRGHLLSDGVVAVLRLPDLGPAVEEALVAGQAVDHRRRLTVQRQVVSLEADRRAGRVADVLAHGQAAMDVEARQRLELVVLGTQTGG